MRFLLTMAVMLSLTGCAGQNFSGWFESEQEKADAVMEEIFEACEDEDAEKISELFSESAKEQIENLDEEVHAFFSYLAGDLESFEETVHLPARTSRAERKRNYAECIILQRRKKRYCLNFYMYARNDENEENTGLYKIEIAAEEDVQQEAFIWDNPELGIFVGG